MVSFTTRLHSSGDQQPSSAHSKGALHRYRSSPSVAVRVARRSQVDKCLHKGISDRNISRHKTIAQYIPRPSPISLTISWYGRLNRRLCSSFRSIRCSGVSPVAKTCPPAKDSAPMALPRNIPVPMTAGNVRPTPWSAENVNRERVRAHFSTQEEHPSQTLHRCGSTYPPSPSNLLRQCSQRHMKLQHRLRVCQRFCFSIEGLSPVPNQAVVDPNLEITPNAPSSVRAIVFCTAARKKPAVPVVNDTETVLPIASLGSYVRSSCSGDIPSAGSAMVSRSDHQRRRGAQVINVTMILCRRRKPRKVS